MEIKSQLILTYRIIIFFVQAFEKKNLYSFYFMVKSVKTDNMCTEHNFHS